MNILKKIKDFEISYNGGFAIADMLIWSYFFSQVIGWIIDRVVSR